MYLYASRRQCSAQAYTYIHALIQTHTHTRYTHTHTHTHYTTGRRQRSAQAYAGTLLRYLSGWRGEGILDGHVDNCCPRRGAWRHEVGYL